MNFKLINMVSYIFCWTLIKCEHSHDRALILVKSFNGRGSHSNRVRKLCRLCMATWHTSRTCPCCDQGCKCMDLDQPRPVEQTYVKDFLSSAIDLLPMVSLHQLLKKQIKWYYDSLAWLSHGLKVQGWTELERIKFSKTSPFVGLLLNFKGWNPLAYD